MTADVRAAGVAAVRTAEIASRPQVWLARHLPQNRDVWMTGGGNGGFNLYTYHYPPKRQMQGKDDSPVGVPGTVELLNSRVISTQPIVSFDWSPDKEGLAVLACLDQTLRVYICARAARTRLSGASRRRRGRDADGPPAHRGDAAGAARVFQRRRVTRRAQVPNWKSTRLLGG